MPRVRIRSGHVRTLLGSSLADYVRRGRAPAHCQDGGITSAMGPNSFGKLGLTCASSGSDFGSVIHAAPVAFDARVVRFDCSRFVLLLLAPRSSAVFGSHKEWGDREPVVPGVHAHHRGSYPGGTGRNLRTYEDQSQVDRNACAASYPFR